MESDNKLGTTELGKTYLYNGQEVIVNHRFVVTVHPKFHKWICSFRYLTETEPTGKHFCEESELVDLPLLESEVVTYKKYTNPDLCIDNIHLITKKIK